MDVLKKESAEGEEEIRYVDGVMVIISEFIALSDTELHLSSEATEVVENMIVQARSKLRVLQEKLHHGTLGV